MRRFASRSSAWRTTIVRARDGNSTSLTSSWGSPPTARGQHQHERHAVGAILFVLLIRERLAQQSERAGRVPDLVVTDRHVVEAVGELPEFPGLPQVGLRVVQQDDRLAVEPLPRQDRRLTVERHAGAGVASEQEGGDDRQLAEDRPPAPGPTAALEVHAESTQAGDEFRCDLGGVCLQVGMTLLVAAGVVQTLKERIGG